MSTKQIIDMNILPNFHFWTHEISNCEKSKKWMKTNNQEKKKHMVIKAGATAKRSGQRTALPATQ